jgi:hypothetical protein
VPSTWSTPARSPGLRTIAWFSRPPRSTRSGWRGPSAPLAPLADRPDGEPDRVAIAVARTIASMPAPRGRTTAMATRESAAFPRDRRRGDDWIRPDPSAPGTARAVTGRCWFHEPGATSAAPIGAARASALARAALRAVAAASWPDGRQCRCDANYSGGSTEAPAIRARQAPRRRYRETRNADLAGPDPQIRTALLSVRSRGVKTVDDGRHVSSRPGCCPLAGTRCSRTELALPGASSSRLPPARGDAAAGRRAGRCAALVPKEQQSSEILPLPLGLVSESLGAC